MLVSATGGISLADGILCPLGTAVEGKRPVRTIGGWRRDDMAKQLHVSLSNQLVLRRNLPLPFWLTSFIASLFCAVWSRTPLIDEIDVAVEPLLLPYLACELGKRGFWTMGNGY